MTLLPFERHCAEIVVQTDLLRSHVAGADMAAPVRSCPGWNLGQLLRHVGGDHRWAEEVVRTEATGPLAGGLVDDVSAYTHEDGAVLDGWLADGAGTLAVTLRRAGPGRKVWTPADGQDTVGFWARRMLYETVVHRADAALATGTRFTVKEELAVDAVEEWLEFSTVPEAFASRSEEPDVLGPGRTLHLDADGAGRWRVDLTGTRPRWRRVPARDEAAVTVHAPVTDLLLCLYRRTALSVEIRGDRKLFDLWRRRAGFWLEA